MMPLLSVSETGWITIGVLSTGFVGMFPLLLLAVFRSGEIRQEVRQIREHQVEQNGSIKRALEGVGDFHIFRAAIEAICPAYREARGRRRLLNDDETRESC